MRTENTKTIGLAFNLNKMTEEEKRLYDVFVNMKTSKPNIVLSLLAIFIRDYGILDYDPEQALSIMLAARYGFLDKLREGKL